MAVDHGLIVGIITAVCSGIVLLLDKLSKMVKENKLKRLSVCGGVVEMDAATTVKNEVFEHEGEVRRRSTDEKSLEIKKSEA